MNSGGGGVLSQDMVRWERFKSRQLLRGSSATLTFRPSASLPLDTEDAIIGLTPGDEELALYDLGSPDLSSFTAEKLSRIHERTQDRFARRVRKLATALIAGSLTLYLWHRLMRDEVKNHALQQALLGGGGKIDDPKRVDGLVRRETDFLARFADEIARETPISPRIKVRAALYGGSGRGVYYREREAILPEGYVAIYLARDDEDTCKPCVDSDHLTVLPGQPPFPGEVCLGRSRCRCTRLLKFDPPLAAYLRTRR